MSASYREALDRESRGVLLAASAVITRSPAGTWVVPASAPARTYAVDLDAGTCDCPDYRNRKVKCKHQYAAEYVAKRVGTGHLCPTCGGTGRIP